MLCVNTVSSLIGLALDLKSSINAIRYTVYAFMSWLRREREGCDVSVQVRGRGEGVMVQCRCGGRGEGVMVQRCGGRVKVCRCV